MSELYNVTPAALREVIERANISGLSTEGKHLLEALQHMADRAASDSPHKQTVKLCDLQSYRSYTLWSGVEDVKFRIESGDYEERLRNISGEELLPLLEEIAERVPWEDSCFTDCSVGNAVIGEYIEDVLWEYIQTKPFIFDADITYDDDHYNQWYADLHASDFLRVKLSDTVAKVRPNGNNPTVMHPEFYANFDLIRHTVAVHARYTTYIGDRIGQDSICLSLTTEEADRLISCFENACRRLYAGKDCLAVLNEVRQQKGMSPIKQSLDSKVRSVQPAGPTDTNPRTDAIGR